MANLSLICHNFCDRRGEGPGFRPAPRLCGNGAPGRGKFHPSRPCAAEAGGHGSRELGAEGGEEPLSRIAPLSAPVTGGGRGKSLSLWGWGCDLSASSARYESIGPPGRVDEFQLEALHELCNADRRQDGCECDATV